MRICILGDASSIHTKRWVDYFVSRGAETHLLSLEPSIGTNGIEHIFHSSIRPRWLKYPLSSSKLADEIKRINPDIVNAHFVPTYGLISAIIGFKPLVISCWGADVIGPPDKKSFLRKMRAKYALRKADLVTTDAEVLKSEVAYLGIPEEKILAIPMGIDQSVFKPRREKHSGFQIINPRKLEAVYNVDFFVRALPFVISNFKGKIKIIISKEGSHESYIKRLVKRLGVEKEVEFIPFLHHIELAKILSTSDVYASTSIYDSTSVSLLEAMACGAFPIVSDIEGNREWIENGENGYLVPIDTPIYLAKKIVQALKNPEFMRAATNKNLSIIRNRAIWKENMKLVEKAFINLVNNFVV